MKLLEKLIRNSDFAANAVVLISVLIFLAIWKL